MTIDLVPELAAGTLVVAERQALVVAERQGSQYMPAESMSVVAVRTAPGRTIPRVQALTMGGMTLVLEPGEVAEHTYSLFRTLMHTTIAAVLEGDSVPEVMRMLDDNH